MKLKLPSSVASPQDLAVVALDVREYAKWQMHSAVRRKAGATPKKPPVISDAAMDLINDHELHKTSSRKAWDEVVEALEDYRHSAPSITVTLAAAPSDQLKQTLVEWCRTNLREDVLVTFSFSSNLLGGMVVRFGSRIFDWSFRSQILASRESFPEALHNV